MSKNIRRKRARRANNQPRPQTVARELTMYPVYAKERVLGETALYLISWATRREWLEQGAIEEINHGTACRLKLNLVPKPQVSITTRGIPDGVVSKLPYALAVLAAWKPRYRAA